MVQRIKTVSLIEDAGGVRVAPVPINVQSDVTVVYDGLLAQSGANQVFLHCGFGNDWHNQEDISLFKTSRGWEYTFKVKDTHTLNFCFKDSANNWDNNNGRNWSYNISAH
ncbi:MAG: carbohydrate-binding protein [Clostridia bacterium]|nr:carbohydrate-binding protein [Clostridia bacterium]